MVAHQIQQRLQPGPQRRGGQAQIVPISLRQVDIVGQRGRAVLAGAQLQQQVGQQRQDVVALAVDLHAQRQVKPWAAAVVAADLIVVGVAALGAHLYVQHVGAVDPVLQERIDAEHPVRLAQRSKVGVGPVQPLLRVGGCEQVEVPLAITEQPKGRQDVQSGLLGSQIPVQQQAVVSVALYERGAAAVTAEKIDFAIRKMQACTEQPEPLAVMRRNRGQHQMHHRHQALQHLRWCHHRGQWQTDQAQQQRGLVAPLGEGRLRYWWRLHQQIQVLLGHACSLQRAAQAGIGVEVERRGVGKPLHMGLGRRLLECQLPQGGRLVRVADLVPLPIQGPGCAQADGCVCGEVFGGRIQLPGLRRQVQGQTPGIPRDGPVGRCAPRDGRVRQGADQAHELQVVCRGVVGPEVARHLGLGPLAVTHAARHAVAQMQDVPATLVHGNQQVHQVVLGVVDGIRRARRGCGHAVKQIQPAAELDVDLIVQFLRCALAELRKNALHFGLVGRECCRALQG